MMINPLYGCQPQANVTVNLAPAGYVTVSLAAAVTGLTQKAIYKKIENGVWLEGQEYRRAPDGRLYISLRGFERWVEGSR